MATVQHVVRDPGGKPLTNALVQIDLLAAEDGGVGPGHVPSANFTILGSHRLWSHEDTGAWSIEVGTGPDQITPNADIVPAGTVYRITERGTGGVFFIIVTSAGGNVEDLLVDPPGAVAPPALVEHIAAPDPHPTYTTAAELEARVAALVNAAPGALDTLDELAAALGDDANFAATVTASLAAKAHVVGLFSSLAATPPVIPSGVTSARSSGYSVAGTGAATYVYDAAVNAAYLAGTNEVQTFTFTGSPTGGTFTLSISGYTTAPIAYNADAATWQAAIDALGFFGPGNAVVAGGPGPGTPLTITFIGKYAKMPMPLFTRTTTLTGGTSPSITIARTTAGALEQTRTAFLAADGRGFKIDHYMITPYQMGALGGTTDDAAAFAAYLLYVHFTDVGVANWGGAFFTSVAQHLGVENNSVFSLTRQFAGALHLKATAASTGHTLFTIHRLDRPVWDSIRVTGNGSVFNWGSRGWRIGLKLVSAPQAQTAGHIWAETFAFSGVHVASGGGNNTSYVNYGSLKFFDCGSGWRNVGNLTGLQTTWSNPVRSGSAGSITQTETINVTTLPPDYFGSDDDFGVIGSAPHYIRIKEGNGFLRLHQIKAIDRTAGTISVFPWISTDAIQEATDYVFGAGLWEMGNDSNVNTWQMFDAIRCGMAYMAGSLYPAIGTTLGLHFCGIGLHVGTYASAASVGLDLRGVYAESNVHDFVFAGLGAQSNSHHFAIDTVYAAVLSEQRIQTTAQPRGADNIIPPLGLRGRLSVAGRMHSLEKPPRQAALVTTLTLDVDRPNLTRTVRANTLAVTMTPLDFNLHRLFGYDTARISVLGTGTGRAPTGTVTFNVPTRAAVNVTLTAGSTAITAPAISGGTFVQGEKGIGISGTGIPAGTTLASVAGDGHSATMSAPATADGTITVNLNWTLNGGTAEVAFSGFAGPPEFIWNFDPVTFDAKVAIVNSAAPAPASQIQMDSYTTAGTVTWSKPTWAKIVTVSAMAGGGGGGSGRKGPAGTVRTGGSAGAGGAFSTAVLRAADLPATVDLTVGTGGAGGAAQTTNSTNGNAGTAGSDSYFGTAAAAYVRAGAGAQAGGGGSTTAPVAGTLGVGTFSSSSGTAASGTGAAGGQGPAGSGSAASGGGAGGGITTGDVASAGGAGGAQNSRASTTVPAGGAIGANGTSATASTPLPGHGGGGGGSSVTGNAGSGGNGIYGGGGAGGGAALDNTGNSGAGGNGGAGFVIITAVG